jgi:hypothetical protein
MTDTEDAAVQIADRALRFDAEYPEDRAEAVVAALREAGMLCEPGEVERLRAENVELREQMINWRQRAKYAESQVDAALSDTEVDR